MKKNIDNSFTKIINNFRNGVVTKSNKKEFIPNDMIDESFYDYSNLIDKRVGEMSDEMMEIILNDEKLVNDEAMNCDLFDEEYCNFDLDVNLDNSEIETNTTIPNLLGLIRIGKQTIQDEEYSNLNLGNTSYNSEIESNTIIPNMIEPVTNQESIDKDAKYNCLEYEYEDQYGYLSDEELANEELSFDYLDIEINDSNIYDAFDSSCRDLSIILAKYDKLIEEKNELVKEKNSILNNYENLISKYDDLANNYNDLVDEYNILVSQYSKI